MRKIRIGLVIAVASAFAWAGAGNKVIRADQSDALGSGDIQIDETNFPDKVFREYVSKEIDKDRNKVLDKGEIEATDSIYIYSPEITSLKGIEYFSNLTQLECDGVDMTNLTDERGVLTELDVSKNTNLKILVCYGNQLTSLDVSQNLKLEWLECCFNQIASLDLSKNTKLQHLDCQSNKITSLKLAECPNLSWLICNENEISSLEVGKCPNLSNLTCYSNHLTQLDVSNNLKIEMLRCAENDISQLDISKLTELTFLECSHNRLTELDVRNCSKLGVLRCEENAISELDLSHNTELYQLFCEHNRLSCLDLKHCPSLMQLDCSFNSIGSLNLEYKSELQKLYCSGCGLSELDVSDSPKLEFLNCTSNALTTLNLHANRHLDYLFAHFNQFDRLDISACEGVMLRFQDPECHRRLLKDDWGDVEKEFYAYFESNGYDFLTVDTDTELVTSISIGDFVERLYTVALGRASEAEGKAYWISEITSGRKTGGDCGLFFLLGEEFTNRNLSDEDYVETLYNTFFDRPSEPDGKAYWVGLLKNGSADHAMVVRSFIDSTEWCNLCADYGVRSGAPTAWSERASQASIDFANRLYECCLGRRAEEAGLNYWSMALTNLQETGCSAAREFFRSEEFTELNLPDKEYIKRLYMTFMDREAETSEIEYWAREIKKGTQTRDSVLAFFGSSEEFTNLCARYGIERGTI